MSLRLRRNALLGAVLTAVLCLVALPSDTTRARAAAAQVTQEGTTTLSAPVVQQGRRPTPSENARLTGTVKFSPERKGRPVVVQRRMGAGSWQRVTVKRQDGSGKVAFAGRAYTVAESRTSTGVWRVATAGYRLRPRRPGPPRSGRRCSPTSSTDASSGTGGATARPTPSPAPARRWVTGA